MDNSSEVVVWEKLNDASYVSIGVYLITLAPTAIFGNCLVLFVFWRKSLYKRPVNWFIVNLAVADLIVSLFAHPMSATTAFTKRWNLDVVGCQVYAFISYTGACNNIMTYAAISYFRCQIVCKNRYIARVKCGRVLVTLVAIWTFSLFWTISPLLGWNTYELEPYSITCSIRWTGHSLGDKSYVWLCLLFVFIFPLSVMIFSYSKIANHARRLSLTTQPSEIENKSKFLYNLERGATRISLMMTMTFVFTWTPYAILSTVAAAGINITSPVVLLPTLFAKSSCAYNPFMFFLSHNTFKSFKWGFASCTKNNAEDSGKLYVNKVKFNNRVEPSELPRCSTGERNVPQTIKQHHSTGVTLTISDVEETGI
ncbi:rhodopsin, G0-coupled-like [Saccostrea cucullata]|uniref:rhodopsin, G0-coupled-like n=1 Tax=Saccostrea cuccullata TaxID=36930 RepID=UPI002ECFF3B3